MTDFRQEILGTYSPAPGPLEREDCCVCGIKLKSALHADCVRKLDADLSETYTDENGTVWTRPTAWAYAQACKALEAHKARKRGLDCQSCDGKGCEPGGPDELGSRTCGDCEGSGAIADGYLIADLRRFGYGDEVLWWGPDRGGYYVDLDRSGIYTEEEARRIAQGYSYLVPVPVQMVVRSLIRRTINIYDGANREIYGNAEKLRFAVESFEKENKK